MCIRDRYDTLLYELGCEPQQARNRLGAYRFRGEDQFKLEMCIRDRSKKASPVLEDEP